MTARISTGVQNAMCNAAVDLLDVAGPGAIDVYTGAQPASANDAPTGTLLVSFTLANPACGDAAVGQAALAGVPISATAVADGDAGWFRAHDSGDTIALDGACGAVGSGEQLELSTVSIVVDSEVQITSGGFTMPAGPAA